MIQALLGAVLTTVAKDVTGKVTKKARVSVTKASANVGMGAGVYALIGPALEGDPTAIGSLVLMAFSYVGVLIGRWRADQEA